MDATNRRVEELEQSWLILRGSLISLNSLPNPSSVIETQNLIDDRSLLGCRNIEEQDFSCRGSQETSLLSPVKKQQEHSDTGESLLDLEELSNFDFMSPSIVLRNQVYKKPHPALKDTSKCIRKFYQFDRLTHQQNSFSRNKQRQTKEPITEGAKIGSGPNSPTDNTLSQTWTNKHLNFDRSTIKSVTERKLQKMKRTQKPNGLAISWSLNPYKQKSATGLLSKRFMNERIIGARIRELTRLLTKTEKLEAVDLSAEKHLLKKCAWTVNQKLA